MVDRIYNNNEQRIGHHLLFGCHIADSNVAPGLSVIERNGGDDDVLAHLG